MDSADCNVHGTRPASAGVGSIDPRQPQNDSACTVRMALMNSKVRITGELRGPFQIAPSVSGHSQGPCGSIRVGGTVELERTAWLERISV